MIYRNPAATVDLIVTQPYISHQGESLGKILLIRRKHPPFQGKWALPGGHLDYKKETLEQAAIRELEEETCLKAKESDLVLLGNYSEPDRDPRDHYITHAYVVQTYSGEPKARDDAAEFGWFDIYSLPELAFDHDKIIQDFILKYR